MEEDVHTRKLKESLKGCDPGLKRDATLDDLGEWLFEADLSLERRATLEWKEAEVKWFIALSQSKPHPGLTHNEVGAGFNITIQKALNAVIGWPS